MRSVTLGLVGWALVLGLAACGDKEPTTTPVVQEDGPGETIPQPPLPDHVPPGIDPKVVEDYERAPVPPPVPFARSDLRAKAQGAGAFEDLPAADPEKLDALLAAFLKLQAEANAKPGTWSGGPAGQSYEPTREEIRLAELGDRIELALQGATPERAKEAWNAAGLGGFVAKHQTFVTVTTKVFGTGYVTTVEARPKQLSSRRER